MTQFIETLVGIFQSSGFAKFGEPGGWLYAVMICVGCFLLYLAIVKEFEPLILLPMAFGMILANLPGSGVIHMQYFVGDGLEHPMWVEILNNGGLADMLYMGVKLGIYPPLIFLGIGTMTDFAPLISNPKSLLLGAAAQFGIFGTYMGARLLAATGLVDFTQKQSAAIAIIGGADGPTAIFVTSRLAPELLGSIAVAAYSYMALVPVIQPPIMKALTSKKERTVVMKQLRTVSDLSGDMVLLQIEPSGNTATAVEASAKESNTVTCRVADPSVCTVIAGGREYARAVLPLFEFGRTINVALPRRK